jgi:seryl-tRNA(Sec) selenium transferase
MTITVTALNAAVEGWLETASLYPRREAFAMLTRKARDLNRAMRKTAQPGAAFALADARDRLMAAAYDLPKGTPTDV